MLEALVSILYFFNKVLLVFNQRTGWIIGALASGTAIIYFIGIELYIFCALEVACFCIMIYGTLGRRNAKHISKYIYGVCAAVTFYLLLRIPDTGIIEFITSLLFMVAFVNLADNRRRTGWIFLAIAHGIMAYITIEKAQYIFASLQAASVIVSMIGSLFPKLVLADLRKV